MKTKKSIAENYNKELNCIIEQLELMKAGQSSEDAFLDIITNVISSAYYDGMREGLNDMNKFIKSNFILKN